MENRVDVKMGDIAKHLKPDELAAMNEVLAQVVKECLEAKAMDRLLLEILMAGTVLGGMSIRESVAAAPALAEPA